jgi:hypothetical protein
MTYRSFVRVVRDHIVNEKIRRKVLINAKEMTRLHYSRNPLPAEEETFLQLRAEVLSVIKTVGENEEMMAEFFDGARWKN